MLVQPPYVEVKIGSTGVLCQRGAAYLNNHMGRNSPNYCYKQFSAIASAIMMEIATRGIVFVFLRVMIH